MRMLRAGQSATLVEVDDLDQMRALYQSVQRARQAGDVRGITDVVPAARTVLVEFDDRSTSRMAVEHFLWELPVEAAASTNHEPVIVDVVYDGDDLDFVCEHLGLSRDEFVAWHCGLDWSVAFTGFAPGFGYLAAPGNAVTVPRLPAPRTVVPAGSVAMAGEFTGVYPRESPGGWRLVGRTSAVLFDLEREPPAALVPGGSVRFREAT